MTEPTYKGMQSFDYTINAVPPEYKCAKCEATNCKLWRQYQTFASHIELHCGPCALKAAGEQGPIDSAGKYEGKYGRTDQVGGLMPAVPTEDGDTFWGYTSVPADGVLWWKRLGVETVGKKFSPVCGKCGTETKAKKCPKCPPVVPPPEIDPRFAETMFVVEADSYALHQLWRDHSREWLDMPCNYENFTVEARIADRMRRVSWKQESMGWCKTIGEVDGRPVCVAFFWYLIAGQRVVFWDATSQVVDHEMIEAWLEKHCAPRWDKGTRLAHTNAENFHHCMDAVREANEAKANAEKRSAARR